MVLLGGGAIVGNEGSEDVARTLQGLTAPTPPAPPDAGLYAVFELAIVLRGGAKFAPWNDDGFGPVEAVYIEVGCSGGKKEFCAGGGGVADNVVGDIGLMRPIGVVGIEFVNPCCAWEG